MKIPRLRFNLYLTFCLVLAGLCPALLAAEQKSAPKLTRKQKKEATVLLFFLETNSPQKDRTQEAPVGRSSPVKLVVDKSDLFNQAIITKAELVPVMEDGFSIKVQFDQKGSWLLENVTALNIGRRLAIQGEFGETRWLAAPLINKRISDGTLVFTPDATREEAERIVRGLNNVAEKIKKDAW